MIADKLNNYRLKANIHTVQIKARGYPATPNDSRVNEAVKMSTRITKNGEILTSLKINPSKLKSDISDFADCKSTIDYITSQLGYKSEDISIVRVDLALDSSESEFYKSYEKLHRYLISALALAYTVKNCYISQGLFSLNTLSIVAKKRDFEIEAYDKETESNGRDSAKTRLELRSKDSRSFIKGIDNAFLSRWRLRFVRALQENNLKRVCQKYNDAIEDKWLVDQKETSQKYGSAKDLYLAYQNVIFTKEQLIDLVMRVERIDESKARTRAENLKKHYPAQFEFFSQKNLQIATDIINKVIRDFFANRESENSIEYSIAI